MKGKFIYLILTVVYLVMFAFNLQAGPQLKEQKQLSLESNLISEANNTLEDDYLGCDTPLTQPRFISISTVTGNSVSGIHEPVMNADGYLVVVSINTNLGFVPATGTSYTVGNTVGNGKVVKAGSGSTFTAEGLSANTNYYVYVFSMKISCPGGPVYRAINPTAVLVRTTATGSTN